MSEPYRGSRLPHYRWTPTLGASLVQRVSEGTWELRLEQPAHSGFAHERALPRPSSPTATKHTCSPLRTETAVGRTSSSFSDPLPQAPPALWGTGTTGGTLGPHSRNDYTLWLIFVSTRLPAARKAVRLQTSC